MEGDSAIVYLDIRIPKIRGINCHNNILVDCVNSAGEMEEKPNF